MNKRHVEDREAEIWAFVERHLTAIYGGDWETYRQTTAEDLGLYEYWIAPHRQDGLGLHKFMIEHRWAGEANEQRFDLLEKRLQCYGDTAIVSYTLLFTQATDAGIRQRAHNESRVLVRHGDGWRVVHVHKSPANWPASE